MPSKQLKIPGTEPASIPEIEEASENYVRARDKRMRLLESEITAKTNLLQVLLQHEDKLSANEEGNKVYRYDDLVVILKRGKLNVKVKSAHDDEEAGDDEEL